MKFMIRDVASAVCWQVKTLNDVNISSTRSFDETVSCPQFSQYFRSGNTKLVFYVRGIFFVVLAYSHTINCIRLLQKKKTPPPSPRR